MMKMKWDYTRIQVGNKVFFIEEIIPQMERLFADFDLWEFVCAIVPDTDDNKVSPESAQRMQDLKNGKPITIIYRDTPVKIIPPIPL